ncbi:unnamed protein product [marine sediment metagenome]|uniref:Uncharacterized protein n=1 Tax=marine sediment metagenome TaxID=412755 RepID=X1BG28_9ZZZZ
MSVSKDLSPSSHALVIWLYVERLRTGGDGQYDHVSRKTALQSIKHLIKNNLFEKVEKKEKLAKDLEVIFDKRKKQIISKPALFGKFLLYPGIYVYRKTKVPSRKMVVRNTIRLQSRLLLALEEDLKVKKKTVIAPFPQLPAEALEVKEELVPQPPPGEPPATS